MSADKRRRGRATPRSRVVVPTAVLALGAALVLGGCSSTTSGSGTTTSSASSPASGTQNTNADKALAEAANLKLSDFPTGWTSNPSQNNVSANDKKLGDQLASCLHVNVALFKSNDPASADSPEFDDSSGNTAQSSVDYQADAAVTSSMMSVIQGSKFPPCMTTALRALVNDEIQHPSNSSDTLPSGASVGSVTFAPMSFPSLGDRSSAFRITVPVSYKGLSFSGYFDLIVIQRGRAVVAMQFFGSDNPFDSSTEQQLSAVVVGRLTST